ncbi:hypothetical protein KQX54_016558 [Cotesia glomerata]|uniref:Uncharacterized protein n=1 Tax=Cotesia glomerata TaxID=32391 RepID=A0AAV7J7A2_COTGL|nr:hypothetical protein KQX54_016558 [Cotesia glomerata]
MTRKVTSPKGIMNQMANRCLRDNMFRGQLSTASNETTWQFCKAILDKKKEITNCIRTNDGVLLIQNDVKNVIPEEEQIYTRCIYNSVVFYGTLYTKGNKTNNTTVYLDNNKIAKIHCFYNRHDQVYVKNFLTLPLPCGQILYPMFPHYYGRKYGKKAYADRSPSI